jgi:hypothetical protein
MWALLLVQVGRLWECSEDARQNILNIMDLQRLITLVLEDLRNRSKRMVTEPRHEGAKDVVPFSATSATYLETKNRYAYLLENKCYVH